MEHEYTYYIQRYYESGMDTALIVAIIALVGTLTSSVFALLSALLPKKMDRKDKKSDAHTAFEKEVLDILAKLKRGVVEVLYDKLKYLGQRYITEGEITPAELHDFLKMYEKAKALDMNGGLEGFRKKVESLDVNENKPKRNYHIDCPLLKK